MVDQVNILAQEKPKVITLADGKEYTLPPVDLTLLANMESLGFGGGKLTQKIETEPMTTMRSLAYALLKENYPALTLEGVGHLITYKELPALTETISIIMAGLR
jgi:uncharacterized protein (UPF0216 family)